MDFLKSLAAFVICVAISLAVWYFISLPVVPCIPIWIMSFLFAQNQNRFGSRIFFISLLSIALLALYGYQVYCEIAYYPEYGNFIAIIFEFVTLATILSAWKSSVKVQLKLEFDRCLENGTLPSYMRYPEE